MSPQEENSENTASPRSSGPLAWLPWGLCVVLAFLLWRGTTADAGIEGVPATSAATSAEAVSDVAPSAHPGLESRPTTHVSPVQQKNLSGITWDGEGLWVTVDGEGKSYRVDPETGEVQRELVLPVAETGGTVFDGESLWQLAYLEKKIYQLDPADGSVRKTIPAPGTGMCAGMTFDGQHLWVGNWEDGLIYRIDQQGDGEILETRDSDFETTGLAWDGRHLWNGVLVGTEEHDEVTPYTGFVQQRTVGEAEPRTLQALPVNGVFAGGSDWLPGQEAATRMWWYDGYHERLMEFRWAPSASAPKG